MLAEEGRRCALGDGPAFNMTLKSQVKGRAIVPKGCTTVFKDRPIMLNGLSLEFCETNLLLFQQRKVTNDNNTPAVVTHGSLSSEYQFKKKKIW